MTRDQQTAPTEALERKQDASGDPIAIRHGKVRVALPLAWVASGLITAAGIAWGVAERVLASREAERQAQMHAVVTRVTELEARATRSEQTLAVEQVLMSSINAKLTELNTRVAEVQVILMRERRP